MIEDINSFTWFRLAGFSQPTSMDIVRLGHWVCLYGLIMVQMCVLAGVKTQNYHVLLLIKFQGRSLNCEVNIIIIYFFLFLRCSVDFFLYYYGILAVLRISVNL